MANLKPEYKVSQTAKAGGSVNQTGGNYTNTTNISLWISFLLIGVLALGGLAWALNIAKIFEGSGNPQQTSQPNPASTK